LILICYDGSADAKAAIEQGGGLLKGEPATVLTVWQPFDVVAARTPIGFGFVPSIPDIDEIDRLSATNARERAEEGARLAREAGFDAQPRTCSQDTTISEAILGEADAVAATAILMGSRGLTGFKSLLLGSVSHAVIQHADRTVIVVPSPQVASSRARARHTIHASDQAQQGK
jgi:nucleotide-binding universal stress UspA family protein